MLLIFCSDLVSSKRSVEGKELRLAGTGKLLLKACDARCDISHAYRNRGVNRFAPKPVSLMRTGVHRRAERQIVEGDDYCGRMRVTMEVLQMNGQAALLAATATATSAYSLSFPSRV
jgi:hypothetical protein